jgi:TonB family protein
MHVSSFVPRSRFVAVTAIFAASLLAQSARAPAAFLGYRTDGMMLALDHLSPGDASKLEQQLAANPDDETLRDKLLKYYWHNSVREPRLESIFWLIEHHPESPLHGNQTAGIMPVRADGKTDFGFQSGVPLNDVADFQRALALWEQQVKEHPQDARVLFNAARVTGFISVNEREIALAERAQELDHGRYTRPLAQLYERILLHKGSESADAERIKSKLLFSKDVDLIGSVAREMIDRKAEDVVGASNGSVWAEVVASQATELLSRARILDPNNSAWSELMEGARELASRPKPGAQTENQRPFDAITISEDVAVMNLLSSPQPVYPPEARTEGLNGTVRFTVRIGADGRVRRVELIGGSPLFANPAREAVQQYVYRPIFLDGAAVEVIAPVKVDFQVPSQQ